MVKVVKVIRFKTYFESRASVELLSVKRDGAKDGGERWVCFGYIKLKVPGKKLNSGIEKTRDL